ncbi:MAG: outer membrane beta-barrel protein, partial [Bacteroidaceae bacterium]
DNDRSMYSIDSLLTKFGGYYTQEQLYLGYIPGLDSLNYCYNAENSQYATYREYNHEANLMFRYNQGENRLNFGVSIQPQTTHMDYAKNLLDTTVVRHTFNWAPRIDYRWKISNTSQLRARFNGRMNQPSMTDLLEVTDSRDPLNISTGNSGLRSSWQNNLDLFYNAYVTEKQRGWMFNARYSQTRNSISSATIYNTETGARYTRPMNIDGNWNTGGAVMFNTAMGKKKYFNVHTFTNLSHNHNVGYLSSNSDGSNWSNIYQPNGSVNMDYIFSTTPLQKATTKTTNISENVRLNFRNDLMEVGVNGGVNYQHARSALQKNANMDNWSFNYGGNLTINAPWGTSLSTDIGEQCRRGYEDASMNTNELIWNAQLSQSFLKDRAATISVQWYDILRERSSISRSISATMRSDSWTNAIHSYVMVHFIYKLNLMGSKGARVQGMGGPGGERGGRGGGGPGRF